MPCSNCNSEDAICPICRNPVDHRIMVRLENEHGAIYTCESCARTMITLEEDYSVA